MTRISSLPAPPLAADNQTSFNTKAFALVGALPKFVQEANALADEIYAISVASPLWEQGIKTGMSLRWPSLLPAPTGYLIRNGAAISRAAYPELFAVIGTAFGAGNGSTTFNLPDDRDRMSIGAGNLYALAEKGGSKDAALIAHSHSINISDPGHRHPYKTYGLGNQGELGNSGTNWDWGYAQSWDTKTGITASAGNSGTSNGIGSNMPPYLAEYGIIKY